jgi:hypothetical protein
VNAHVSDPLPAGKIELRRYDAHEFVLASFSRAIEGAPLENRRRVFRLIAHDSFRRCCAELWDLAENSGLLEQFGEVTISDDITSTFWSGQ